MGHTWPFLLLCGPVWSLYNIESCCHVIVHVIFWVELPRTKETLPIFVKSWVSEKRGHDGVVSGYLTSTSIPRVDRLSTGPPG